MISNIRDIIWRAKSLACSESVSKFLVPQSSMDFMDRGRYFFAGQCAVRIDGCGECSANGMCSCEECPLAIEFNKLVRDNRDDLGWSENS